MSNWIPTKELRWIKTDRGKPYQGGVSVQCQVLYRRPTGRAMDTSCSRTGFVSDVFIPEYEEQWRDVAAKES